mmetsp:Transcript_3625/g.5463  ORF Transcript_3625/g.5463 Transcript_3625/m.5463 type:complete len:202 (-) Transcript_3625:296-901(-)
MKFLGARHRLLVHHIMLARRPFLTASLLSWKLMISLTIASMMLVRATTIFFISIDSPDTLARIHNIWSIYWRSLPIKVVLKKVKKSKSPLKTISITSWLPKTMLEMIHVPSSFMNRVYSCLLSSIFRTVTRINSMLVLMTRSLNVTSSSLMETIILISVRRASCCSGSSSWFCIKKLISDYTFSAFGTSLFWSSCTRSPKI